MSEFQIHEPKKEDIRWVVGREFEFLPAVDPAFSPQKMGFLQRLVLKHLALPSNYRRLVGRILRVGEERVGYLFARPGTCTLRIESLGVVPEHRRQGMASQLLDEAAAVANSKDLEFLSANLTPENIPALGLFEKHGFRGFQRDVWRRDGADGLSGEAASGEVRELSPRELIDGYKQWTGHELAQGDPWAEAFVLCEQPRRALVTQARHWACLLDGEEAGYLRAAGLMGHFRLYLASRADSWGQAVQLGWLAAAMDNYPTPPSSMELELASSGHHQAARDLLLEAGFEPAARPRFTMIRSLE